MKGEWGGVATAFGQAEFGQYHIWPNSTGRIWPTLFGRIWPILFDRIWPDRRRPPREKNENCGEREKKSEILGGPAEGRSGGGVVRERERSGGEGGPGEGAKNLEDTHQKS